MLGKNTVLWPHLAGVATVVSLFGPVQAAFFSWEPTPINSLWSNAINWAGPLNGVPDGDDDIVMISGVPSNGIDPVLNANFTIGDITVNNGGDVNLGAFQLTVRDASFSSGTTTISSGTSEFNVQSGRLDTDNLVINLGGRDVGCWGHHTD